jgi:hypothetical protein
MLQYSSLCVLLVGSFGCALAAVSVAELFSFERYRFDVIYILFEILNFVVVSCRVRFPTRLTAAQIFQRISETG